MKKDTPEIEFVELLEDARRKYQEYLELSKVYELPDRQERAVQYEPPTPKNPLTKNGIYD